MNLRGVHPQDPRSTIWQPGNNLPQGVFAGDPIILEVREGSLWIQRLAVKCTVQDSWSKIIDLPVSVSGRKALEALAGETAGDIVASGLGKVADGLAADIAKAAAILAKHGLEDDDIRRLIEWKKGRRKTGDLFGEG